MNKRKQKYYKAFTLLEMLVAMAIMAVVAASLYSTLYIAFKAKKNIQRTVTPIINANIIFDYLKSDLLCAISPANILSDTFQGSDKEQNDNDILSFCTSSYIAQEDEVACDIYKAEYALEKIDQWDDLVLVRYKTTNLLSPNVTEPKRQVIGRYVRDFDVKYYDGYDWFDSWDSSTNDNELPEAVLITITIATDTGLNTSASKSITIARQILLPANPSTEEARL